ncbi:MAG TPA: Crp/Fnr family transcriptional regulator [Propionibacteriaceae bacterium]|nr:Crp/Fnr family transcriptional regulator [Propionibacteriaceae bacterium]
MTDWPVLSSLSAADRERVLGAGRRRRFARGETLFHHGDPADALHLLERGRVAVRVLTPQGDQVILAVLGPGQVFGELALIDPQARRTATVTALEACETIALRRRQFESLRAADPQVDRFLVASLAAQVARLSEHLLEMLFVAAHLRVIRRLLVLAEEYGEAPIPMTQEELGLMSGTTRPTVNEVLRDLERQGAVRLRRGRIEVLDADGLQRRLDRALGRW